MRSETWPLAVAGFDMRELTYEQIGELLRRLGIRRFELPLDPLSPDISGIEGILGRFDVQIVSVGPVAPIYRLNATDDVPKVQRAIISAIEYARGIGAQYVNIGLGPNSRRDPFTTIQLLRRFLGPCLERAEALGITIVAENHFDMRSEDPHHLDVMRRPPTLAALFDAVGSRHFRFVYDPGNFYIAGEEAWPQAYRILKPFIEYVHLKDAVRSSELLHAGPQRTLTDSLNGPFVTVPLGDGGVNFEGLFADLIADQYTGMLVLEAFTPLDRIEPTLASSLAYIRAHLPATLAANTAHDT